MNFISRLLFLV